MTKILKMKMWQSKAYYSKFVDCCLILFFKQMIKIKRIRYILLTTKTKCTFKHSDNGALT